MWWFILGTFFGASLGNNNAEPDMLDIDYWDEL